MFSKRPLTGLNYLEVIFYYFSPHFQQYLISHALRCLLVGPEFEDCPRIHYLSHNPTKSNSKVLNHSICEPIDITQYRNYKCWKIYLWEELDWPVRCGFLLHPVGTTCLLDYNLLSKNNRPCLESDHKAHHVTFLGCKGFLRSP